MTPSIVEHWHQVIRTGDLDAIGVLLAENVAFHSPVLHTPQTGKALTEKYLKTALHLLKKGSFTYINEWIGDASCVLEFTAQLDGIAINGVDILEWNPASQITSIKVMVRPLKAINLLREMMGQHLPKSS